MGLTRENLDEFNLIINKIHENTDLHTGYEINDRAIFIKRILEPLGYSSENILQDVPQKGEDGSKSADIRLYGKHEYKSKHSHSQFIIETKNFQLLSSYGIDYLQLKRYIKFNKSKIRLIALTDYNNLYLFNASEIKKNINMNFNNLNAINDVEKNIFKNECFLNCTLNDITTTELNNINLLSYQKVFGNQKFINPQDYEATNSITDPYVRKNFILNLYHLMIKFQSEISPIFDMKILDVQSQLSSEITNRKQMIQLLAQTNNLPIRNYFLWGIEMNYLDNFMLDKDKFNYEKVINFLHDRDIKDAFILTSVYNLINKTMFLRILEDTSTANTKFVEGIKNGRYISNGILEEKRKQSEEELINYFISVFKFEQEDLRAYDFILSKDIYNWLLDLKEYQISHLLIELIRLFNDINFKKVNQDILGDVYEHYLEQEEEEISRKNSRRLLGQYYTPKPIVRFMWYLTRDVVKKGLKRDLYEGDQNYLSIIDPACGSGTFLSEAILQINEAASTMKINKDGKVFSLVSDRKQSKKIEDSLYGFELNPLSKSIAEINIFFGLIQTYGNYTKNEMINFLNIYRTDSLKNLNNKELENLDFEEQIMFLQDEIKNSYKQNNLVKNAKNKKYDIVIGNPPYGATKVNSLMKKELIPFAFAENNFQDDFQNVSFNWNNTSFSGNVPSEEKNIGKLNDLYAYFFGTADYLCAEEGVVSYITSNTYLTIPTYKWLRKYLLENYQIEYIVNFNDISEKSNSMFYPDAGVATSIIIMRKKVPTDDHEIKYLDLKNLKNIKDKYEAFCNVTWGRVDDKVNKNDIKNFTIKNIDQINFGTVKQKNILKNNDFIFSFGEKNIEALLNKIEAFSVPITTYATKNSGADVGDLALVSENINDLEDVIKEKVYKGNVKSFGNTARNHIINQLKANKIDKKFCSKKIIPFVYQKHMKPYGFQKKHWTYMDPDILWRSRIKDKEILSNNAIYQLVKLFILERRAKGEILSVVTDENIVPQHGGRFMYIVSNKSIESTDLYFFAAIINSKLLQFLYKKRLIGNKDILVPKLELLNHELKQKIIQLSLENHKIQSDIYNFQNNINKFQANYTTKKYDNNFVINILEENEYWTIKFKDSLIQNYSVDMPILNLEENEIRLNESIIIHSTERENESKLKSLFLNIKDYKGDILEKSLMINIIKLLNNEDTFLIELKKEIKKNNDCLDLLIFSLYGLNSEEIKLIEE